MQSYPDPNEGIDGAGQPFYSSGQQQNVAPNSNELQLTAQLSRELGPVIGAEANMAERQGSHGPGPGNANHQYEPSPHQQHQQMSAFPNHMDQMRGGYVESDDPRPSKKRNTGKAGGDKKASRACDECRRKKVKCDATRPSDGGLLQTVPCSNCKRTNVACQFQHEQQKRGPSKGYIKDLADRVNKIEHRVGYCGRQESPLQRLSEDISPPPNAQYSPLKRTHSMVSNDFPVGFQSQGPRHWSPQNSARQLQPDTYSDRQSHPLPRNARYTSHDLPNPQDWNPTLEMHAQNPAPSFQAAVDMYVHRAPELHIRIFDGYGDLIHPTFPILTCETTKLVAKLENVPKILKAAFQYALHVAVQSFPGDLHQGMEENVEIAAKVLHAVQFEGFPRTRDTDLIHIQAYVLLVIAVNNVPAFARRSQNKFALSILAEAISLAYSMKMQKVAKEPLDDDPESDGRILRRVWLSLVCLDRWGATFMDKPPTIHEYNVVLLQDDKAACRGLYELTRMSLMLGHASRAIESSLESPSMSLSNVLLVGTLLRGEAERIRESIPENYFPTTEAPIWHICYWSTRIFCELALVEASPGVMATAALNLVTQLNFHTGLFGPLMHFSVALAALTLINLLEYEDTRDEAEKALKSWQEARIIHSSWDEAVHELINTRTQHLGNVALGMSSSKVALQSLQRLADIATADGETRDVDNEERKQVETGKASGLAPVNAGEPYRYFHNLRRLVGNGVLNGFDNIGEPAR